MGSRGPVPKRSSQRRRANKPPIPVTAAPTGATSPVPELRDGLHPLAVRWFEALAASGQSAFYEPSDWAQALVVAEAVDSFAREPQAAMLRTILTASTSLLVTEGDRRRLQVELQRTPVDADEAAAVAALDSYRERLA